MADPHRLLQGSAVMAALRRYARLRYCIGCRLIHSVFENCMAEGRIIRSGALPAMSEEVGSAKRPSPHDGLPAERRRWAVAAIFTALAVASLDTAIANIALPAIAADLRVSPEDVIWVVNVYQIALVATLLPLGALGEIVGHERIYLGGLLLFTLASLASACAWSLESLLVARTLQGLGASGMMSVNTALVRFVYPSHLLGRGFGHNALVVATATTLGPTVAAGILALGPWPWLFAVNIPIGLIAIAIGLKTLPRPPRAVHPFDFFGALMAAGALGLIIIGISGAAHHAAIGLVSIALVVGIVLGWLLVRRHAGHPAPMLPVDLFRLPIFALSAATAVVALPFYFQETLHRTAVETGLFMTPWPLVVAIMAPIAGRLSDHYPAGILGGIGLALLCVGMGLLATLPAAPDIANIVWPMALCGCGFGFFQAPNLKALMSSAPAGRSGSASSIVATARLTGQTIGAALAASCFSFVGRDGAVVALALAAGVAAVGSLMSFLRLIAIPRPG
jgi:DHA2 family multidrug resistance protein-like MFS transporter